MIKDEKEKIEELNLHTVKTIINGNCLENKVPGFKTINIFGRSVLNRKAKIEGSDASGSFIRLNKFDGRELTIEYVLRAENNRELMRRAELLNYYLFNNENIELRFTDDKFSFFGQVSEVEPVEETTNIIVSRFKFFCEDFKKYGENIRVENLKKFNFSLLYPVIPHKIEIVANTSAKTLKVTNNTTGKNILLTGDFKAGDVIEIYPLQQEVKRRSENMLKYLNIKSNLEDFEIHYFDELITTNCIVNIEFKEPRI